jgi:hypothetical protein
MQEAVTNLGAGRESRELKLRSGCKPLLNLVLQALLENLTKIHSTCIVGTLDGVFDSNRKAQSPGKQARDSKPAELQQTSLEVSTAREDRQYEQQDYWN